MITETHTASCEEIYLRIPGADPLSSFFFDIETTGFRPSTSHLYLIGVCSRTGRGWEITQWMSEKPQEEAALLRVFAAFASTFQTILHFNGERFDIPYLQEKYGQYALPSPFDGLSSIDLYRTFRPLRPLLSLDSMKQKSLEAWLGIRRDDLYDGGALIKVYRSFCKTGDPREKELLLLHNREDVAGMLSLLSYYGYLDMLSGHLRTAGGLDETILPDSVSFPSAAPADPSTVPEGDVPAGLSEEIPEKQPAFTWTMESDCPVPRRLLLRHPANPAISVLLDGRTALFHIPVFRGTLRYYLDHPENYYYLPEEDMAVHKSVAMAVDPKYRRKATKDTCYIRRTGTFWPLPAGISAPAFSADRKDPLRWLEAPETDLPERSFLTEYACALLKEICPVV